MLYSTLIYETRDHIAYITLNRPEADNAIDMLLAQELEDACQRVNQSEDIRVLILRGAGDKAFCSGNAPGLSPGYSVANTMAGITCPVIAAINGEARAEGLELALSCDIRIASKNARFDLPQVTLGHIPKGGGTQRLPRIVGRTKAMEMILTGQVIDAQEALRIGLVNKVLPQDRLIPEVEQLAMEIASKGPIAARYAKEAVSKGLDLTLEQGLRLEADLYFLLQTTQDRIEGIIAFRGKRKPQFKGQ